MSHLIQMLKNQVQFLICYNYVQKFHHRRVIELLQNGNFSDQGESWVKMTFLDHYLATIESIALNYAAATAENYRSHLIAVEGTPSLSVSNWIRFNATC